MRILLISAANDAGEVIPAAAAPVVELSRSLPDAHSGAEPSWLPARLHLLFNERD